MILEENKVTHALAFHGNVDDVFKRNFFLKMLHFICPFKKRAFFGTKAVKTLESKENSNLSKEFDKENSRKDISED